MEWNDEEFEAYLQQFRPAMPSALPVPRPPVRRLAFVAAAVLAAILVPLGWWLRIRNDAPNSKSPAPVSDPTAVKLGRDPNGNQIGRLQVPIQAKHWVRPGYRPQGASGGAIDRRLRVGNDMATPPLIERVNPRYPESAQAAGIEGLVLLEVVIGEDGSVVETWVIQSVAAELDQAA